MLLFHVSFELIESLQHSVNKSDTHSKKEAVFSQILLKIYFHIFATAQNLAISCFINLLKFQ